MFCSCQRDCGCLCWSQQQTISELSEAKAKEGGQALVELRLRLPLTAVAAVSPRAPWEGIESVELNSAVSEQKTNRWKGRTRADLPTSQTPSD
jgi:hypothetical protein